MECKLIRVAKKDNDLVVNGRELYDFLEIDTCFNKWVEQVLEYGFKENMDYIKMSHNGDIYYIFNIDMAKEICTITCSHKGKDARKYFIEIIKGNREEELQKIRETLSVQNKRLTKTLKDQNPKVEYYDSILRAEGLVTISQIAMDYGMTGVQLNERLRQFKIQYKQSGQWQLYDKYKPQGYVHSYTSIKDGKAITNTRWTQKGRYFINQVLKQHGIYSVTKRQFNYN